MITCTALTPIVVPAGFSLIDDIERRLGPKVRRVIAEPTVVPPTQRQPAS